ncbi:putative MATE family efflux protein [Keratinibaculum paraultunense]|uniref:Probable multidrug resistance protein NorM n=1 Tax=Keratinibaculum paraultunense TaxID=1278232 RepID=A0A4R3KZR8_9FIRM|nr:MATE family efflux transporter [Keratinibaculum paraultunense]QQY80015.1 MATE family efflux transporter [Keratinibaculum paraultunense]TCS91662.1 putative MATE family efflux protein [Keratinibaculum paraultunense]
MRRNTNNGENKIIRKKILSMILPITLENILQMTAGIVSMAMVGRISPLAVGAVGISNIIFNIIWAIFKGVATGTSVFVAQSYGAKNYNKLKRIVEQTLLSSIILVIIFQQLLFWSAGSLLKIFDPSPELLANGTLYLRVISWGLPFIAIVLMVAGVLQGMGDARTPMRIAFIMNIFNICFSYIFIFGKLGIKPMGLKGAAFGILIAQLVAALLGFKSLFGKHGVLKEMGGNSSFSFKLEEVIPIYRVGLPTSFETIFWEVAAIFLAKAILTYGEIAYAAYQLGLQAEAISYMPAAGFGVAATTFLGHAIGSQDKEQGKKYIRQLIKWTSILTIFTGGVLLIFPSQIMRLLTNDIQVIEIGAMYLFIMGIVQLPQNINGVLNGALRGAGYSKIPMVVAILGLWLIRVPLSLLVAYVLNKSITFIWIAFGLDLVFRFIVSLIIFKRKNIYESKSLIGVD